MVTHNSEVQKNDSTTEKVKTAAKDTVEQAKHRTEELAGEAQVRAKETLTDRKQSTAQGLDGVAEAFRETGQHLREHDQDAMGRTVAQYTDKLADQMEQFSRQLQDKDIGEIVAEVEEFARNQPAVFLGGAFAAGLLLGRFFRSSGSRYSRTGRDYNYQRHYEVERPITRRSTELPAQYRTSESEEPISRTTGASETEQQGKEARYG